MRGPHDVGGLPEGPVDTEDPKQEAATRFAFSLKPGDPFTQSDWDGAKGAALDWNQPITPGPREVGFDYNFIMAATGDRVPCVYVEGPRVVGLDLNRAVENLHSRPEYLGRTCDVTDESAVLGALRDAVLRFGGGCIGRTWGALGLGGAGAGHQGRDQRATGSAADAGHRKHGCVLREIPLSEGF